MTREDATVHTGSWAGVWKSEFPEDTKATVTVSFPYGQVVTSEYANAFGILRADVLHGSTEEVFTLGGELISRTGQ
jgi:hypothetical protein